MKISVEMKVAAAVGAVLMALTLGAIAQGRSGSQTGSPNSYEPTNDPGVNTYMSRQGHNSSLPGRTNAKENRQKFSNQDQAATTFKKATKIKTLNRENIRRNALAHRRPNLVINL